MADIWIPGEGWVVQEGGGTGYADPTAPQNYQPKQPTDNTERIGGEANNPYAGMSFEELARSLMNPAKMNARELERAIASGWINPDMANRAQIQKDAWLSQYGASRSGRGPSLGSNVEWQQAMAADPSLANIDFSQWYKPWDQSNYNAEQPVLQWQGGYFPHPQRQAAEGWLRGQGFAPNQGAGLGQFGYRQWTSGQPYRFNPAAVQAIPDESLRQWMQKYLIEAKLLR